MGLLDTLTSEQGLLGLSLLAAAAPKERRTSIGEGLLMASQNVMQQRNAQEERAARMRMQQMQEQQLQMQLADRQRQQQQMEERSRYLSRLDPNQGPPMQHTPAAGMAVGLSPQENAMLMPQGDEKPLVLSPGQVAFRNGKPMFSVPKEQAPDEFERALRAAGIDPSSPVARKMAMDRLTKLSTHQPATQVSVNTEKPLLNTVAQGLGKQIDDSLGAARAATSAISTAQTLRAAVDSGKIVAGPGATFRVLGLQVGQMLGVGGKNGAEILANTRTAIKSMAQAELDAAQQMKGQGQITESERDIIRRAAAGNIDDLTAPEIRLLSDAMEKTGRFKIAQHKNNVKGLANMPGAAPLLPFYQVDEPPAYQAPGGVDLGGGFKLKK